MKIFAIRDRLLDYYQRPMVFDRAPDILAAIAKAINSTGPQDNEIQQAPEHFELWEIGEVDDQGNLTPRRNLIANCSSLIRNGVWQRRVGDNNEAAPATLRVPGTAPAARGGPTDRNGTPSVQNPVEAAGSPPAADGRRPEGSH